MTTHHCPACELIYTYRSQLEQHLREDHPSRHFDYPLAVAANADWPMSREAHRPARRPR